MPQNAFSPDGYIVDQAQCGGLRYGVWRSDRNGCGWIAAYNYLRALGRAESVQGVLRALLRLSLLRGLLGTRMLIVRFYLKRLGLRPVLAPGRNKTLVLADGTRPGILLYRHRGGWHFSCFLPEEGGKFRFLNAWAGQNDPVLSMAEFFQSCVKSRFTLALTARDASPSKAV